MELKLTRNIHQPLQSSAETVSIVVTDVDVSKFEWVINPSVANSVSRLTTCEQEQLIDITSDVFLKQTFDADKFCCGCL
jgi:hypothetical protein